MKIEKQIEQYDKKYNIISKVRALLETIETVTYQYAELLEIIEDIRSDVSAFCSDVEKTFHNYKVRVILLEDCDTKLSNKIKGYKDNRKHEQLSLLNLLKVRDNLIDFLKTFFAVTSEEYLTPDIIISDFKCYSVYNLKDNKYYQYSGDEIREILEREKYGKK